MGLDEGPGDTGQSCGEGVRGCQGHGAGERPRVGAPWGWDRKSGDVGLSSGLPGPQGMGYRVGVASAWGSLCPMSVGRWYQAHGAGCGSRDTVVEHSVSPGLGWEVRCCQGHQAGMGGRDKAVSSGWGGDQTGGLYPLRGGVGMWGGGSGGIRTMGLDKGSRMWGFLCPMGSGVPSHVWHVTPVPPSQVVLPRRPCVTPTHATMVVPVCMSGGGSAATAHWALGAKPARRVLRGLGGQCGGAVWGP